ncbi:LysR family transcriptional regulator [Desmospora activa]|uniref:DNA-binding transcriptional LysR family regulator n=1 Tax=Desmospora activa DSM 45169 TaxID=1121389 RepID=A0A2T4ZD82_9BACL|nr:LysR family transcriptional regulator [Desmospora activa]PTM59840.1 DNA-binding transcriptional LysR family regulator [Desmospora activa DSM 45169]
MELRHLITFRTIVDVGGFKKAAEELGYAQSSITTHIKELEKELGTPLFDRFGKNITLTQTGKRFLPYAVDIIQLYSKSKETIDDTDEPSGQLTVGASESAMIHWIPTVISTFMKDYPKVELILKSLDYPDVSAQLSKGDIDLAILVETSPWSPKELTVKKLKEEKLVLVQSAKNGTAIKDRTMLYMEQACSWRSIFENHVQIEGKTSITKVELASIEAIKQCVSCGLGTSLLPHFTVKDELESGELKAIEADVPNNAIALYAAFHKNKWITRSLDAFLNVLTKRS